MPITCQKTAIAAIQTLRSLPNIFEPMQKQILCQFDQSINCPVLYIVNMNLKIQCFRYRSTVIKNRLSSLGLSRAPCLTLHGKRYVNDVSFKPGKKR